MSPPIAPPIGAVVGAIIGHAADTVFDTKPAALRDEPDAVHQHRTAVRRLRSVLAGFAPLVDGAAARRLRVAFGEWGGQLGVVRDAEVRAAVAADALERRGVEDPAVWTRLVTDERTEYRHLHARLVELATASRLAEAEAALREFAADPKVIEPARGSRGPLRRVVEHEAERVRRAARRVDEGLEAQHRLRKAARRLRYVAEALDAAAPEVLPGVAARIAAAGEAVHDLLGDHRDLVIFAERLERERARAARDGEAVQVYDILLAHAQDGAHEKIAGVEDAVTQIRRAVKGLRS